MPAPPPVPPRLCAACRARAPARFRPTPAEGSSDSAATVMRPDVGRALLAPGPAMPFLRRAKGLGVAAVDEGSASIRAFQRACLAAGDRGRQPMSSALRPPARTPHGARFVQTRRDGVGFRRRLLGP